MWVSVCVCPVMAGIKPLLLASCVPWDRLQSPCETVLDKRMRDGWMDKMVLLISLCDRGALRSSPEGRSDDCSHLSSFTTLPFPSQRVLLVYAPAQYVPVKRTYKISLLL